MGKKLAENKENVDLRFKIMSAIGIIIIVSGHCYHGGMELAYNWFPPYSFNIAMFVFISGYFYSRKYEESIPAYLWKRTKRLVIPAYIWNLIYALFIAFMSVFGFTIGAELNFYNVFIMPFFDGEAFQYNLGSWFVYPLFCTCVFNILFRKFLKPIHRDNEYVILIVYTAIGLLGIHLAIMNAATGIGGPLKLLLRTMFFIPCFEFGQFYRNKLEKHDNLGNLPYFAIIFAVQLILLSLNDNLEYTPSSCTGFRNGIIIPYVTAVTAIAFWLRISRLLVPVLGESKIIRTIADNTYIIMINHLSGFFLLKLVFYALSEITPLFDSFNAASFKSSIWYYYLPDDLQQWALVYLAAGILVPILINTAIKKVNHLIMPKAK